jgi:hypothetical protein
LVWQADCGPEPSAAFVDQYISTEIPNPREDPLGFVLVQEFMMHGPCGELNKSCLCMKDGHYTKKNIQRLSKTKQPVTKRGFLSIDVEILVLKSVKVEWIWTIDGLSPTTCRF